MVDCRPQGREHYRGGLAQGRENIAAHGTAKISVHSGEVGSIQRGWRNAQTRDTPPELVRIQHSACCERARFSLCYMVSQHSLAITLNELLVSPNFYLSFLVVCLLESEVRWLIQHNKKETDELTVEITSTCSGLRERCSVFQ